MSQSSANGWNGAGIVLYVLLIPVAYVEFILAGLAFGMVMLVSGAGMLYGLARKANVFYMPFLGLVGLFIVFMIGMAVLH